MKYFSVPADFKKGTIDEYARLNKTYEDSRIIETYGQITVNSIMESGRAVNMLPQTDINMLAEYVAYSKEKSIDFNYTINAPYIMNREFNKEGIEQIKFFLGQLYKMGIRWLTISMPSLFELVKNSGYDFHIKASTICQVTSANKANWLKKIGAERIVLDESINRDYSSLRTIRNTFGEHCEVIVNSICHKDCINKMFHYNEVSGDSIGVSNSSSVQYYPYKCILKRNENISNILKLSWVRPEDIKYYTNIGINHFKLQGRQLVLKGDPVRAVECYIKECFDGNLVELLDMFSPIDALKINVDNKKLEGYIQGYYENPNLCKNDCLNCTYCESYARKAIDYEKAEKICQLARTFYSQLDNYEGLVKSV